MKTLNDMPHRKPSAGMTVPEGFFADFRERMERQIDAYEAKRAVRQSLWSRLRGHALGRRVLYVASVAACVVLLVGIFPAVRSLTGSDVASVPVLADEASGEYIHDQDVADFMLANVSDYDIYMAYYYEE